MATHTDNDCSHDDQKKHEKKQNQMNKNPWNKEDLGNNKLMSLTKIPGMIMEQTSMMATSRHKVAGAASTDLLKADFVQPTLLPTTVRCPDKGRAGMLFTFNLATFSSFLQYHWGQTGHSWSFWVN